MTKIRKPIAILLILLMSISGMPHMAFADEVTESEVVVEEPADESGIDTEEASENQSSGEELEEPEILEEAIPDGDDTPIEDEAVEETSDSPDETQEEQDDIEEEMDEVSSVETEEQMKEPSEQPKKESITETEPAEEADNPSEEIAEQTEEAEEQAEEIIDPELVSCKMTIILQDVRDDIAVERNGEPIARVVGNPSPGSGSFFTVGQTMLEEMAKNSDGTTSIVVDAMTGDTISIKAVQPAYAVIHYYADEELQPERDGIYSIVSFRMDGDTVVTVNGDYSAAAGYYAIPRTRGTLKAASSQTLPDAIYVSLGSAYDTYSSTATVNGHRGVYFFQPEGLPDGLYVSATCGSTTKHMVSGTHYKVARISEYAARAYLDYGTGCCSQRAQRALAWITHHGQSEYDWNRANKNLFVMGDGQLSVANQLEAYTITFLAAWVCTNDGRVGSYGTVHVEDGAHALDFMFGSSFSTGLPATTKAGIDKMVAWGLAFADAHPDGDENIPEYQQTFVYSDGNGAHQPLLIGAYQGESEGKLTIKKTSTNTYCTDGNPMYSFEGTTFVVKDSNGNKVGTLSANAAGKTGELELEAGTYTVTETKAGKGYILSTEVKKVTVESGKTATVTFANEPIRDPASMYIRKWDKELDRYNPQGAGTFKGAQYRFDFYGNQNWSGTPLKSWVFEADENGIIRYLPSYKVSGPDLYQFGSAYLYPLGSLKITEVKAPEGYTMSTDILYGNIVQEGNAAKFYWTTETLGLIKAYADGSGIYEEVIRGGVRFKKSDSETGGAAQSSATLKDAEITVYNNSDNAVLVDGKTVEKGAVAFVLYTDENGIAETANDLLPYGSYYAVETKPSEGYELNTTWRVDFQIRTDGQIVDCSTGSNVLKEQIIRGDLSMLKLDVDGNYKPNIPFMIVQIDKEGNEGEWHVIVTDENGKIDTSSSARLHTNGTNSLDQYVDGGVFTDTSKLDPTVGVWFGDSEPNDEFGALPYGSYRVYELQTEQLMSEQVNLLESEIVSVTEPHQMIVLHPMVNLNVELTSSAASSDTGMEMIPASEGVAVQDTVYYTNLTAGRRYTMETQFVLKSDISVVLGTASKDFYPGAAVFTKDSGTVRGEVTLETVIDISEYSGESIVAFDYLYEYVKGTKALIASHTDLEDKAQTLRVPAISTTAKDGETKDNVGTVKENAEIIDTVMYTNLKRGEIFKLVAKLIDAETEECIKDAEGNDLIVEKRFMCGKQDDSVEMPAFRIDSNDYQGKSIVVVEELYWIDEEHGNKEVLMTSHESLDDKDQTITYPVVHTAATDTNTESHVGVVSEETTVVDEVQLKGLIIGKEYTVSGKLVYQTEYVDKDHKLHKAGDPVSVKETSWNMVIFTAEAEEMAVTLTYVVDTHLLEGTTVVVYEDLKHNDVIVASHADLTDEGQSVHYPSIRTKAIDKTSGTCFVTKGEEVFFVDTVSYTNLVVGEKYIIHGVLMDKGLGESLGITAQSEPFEALQSDGEITVEFAVNTEELNVDVIVVFEDLYLVKEDGTEILITRHEDLNDEAQSLYNPEIGTTATDYVSGTHEAQATEKTVIRDAVAYRNLKVGEEYTVVGVLMDKATGSPVIINGERVTATKTFTAETSDGTVALLFEFDGSAMTGNTVVAFERVLYEGFVIAVHADIEDEAQSVDLINIRTSARDKESGSQKATWSNTAVIVDTVFYEGLTPGKTYTMYGVIMVKSTGKELVQQGITVSGLTEFVPAIPNGIVEVSFVVNTEVLQVQEIVVFESLYAGSMMNDELESDIPVAKHEDIHDKDQTITIPVRPKPPVPYTGDNTNIPLWGGIACGSLGGLLLLFRKKRRR